MKTFILNIILYMTIPLLLSTIHINYYFIPIYLISFSPFFYILYNYKNRVSYYSLIIFSTVMLFLKSLFIQVVFFSNTSLIPILSSDLFLYLIPILLIILLKIMNKSSFNRGVTFVFPAIFLLEYFNPNDSTNFFSQNMLNFPINIATEIVPALSSLILFIASYSFLMLFFSKRGYVKFFNLIVLIILNGILLYPHKPTPIKAKQSLKVLVVQQKLGHHNSTINTYNISRVRVKSFIKLTEEHLKKQSNIEMVIWPESILLFPLNAIESPRGKAIVLLLENFRKKHKLKYLVLGTQYINDDNNSLSGIVIFNNEKRILIKKKYRVPFLESMELGANSINENIKFSDKIVRIKGIPVLFIICYEAIRTEFLQAHSGLIINLSNENIFTSKVANHFTRDNLRRLAINNNSYIVKAGSPGYSVIFDNKGQIVKDIKFGASDAMTYSVPLLETTKASVYSFKYLSYLLLLFLVINLILIMRKKD